MSLVDSPFADRLHTNYTPSDSEMEQLRALLQEPTNKLVQVDAQIAEMDALIGQLRAEQASLQAKIFAHRALMSPIRRVPLDILQEIFLACLPTTHDALIDPGEAPLLLGRICKHWRSVAYSTPVIWSSIHIPSISGSVSWNGEESEVLWGIERKLGSFVQAWLDRSRACPLSISLSLKPYGFDPRPHQHPVISQITRGSSRIRRLNLCVHISEMQSLLLLGVDDLPLLESLHIQCPSDNQYPITRWSTFPIFQVPTLQRISLHVKADALTLPLRWSQLTNLNLACFSDWTTVHGDPWGGLDQKGALELLHRCPNLVWCRLHATTSVPFTAGPSLTLPHLKVLILAEFFDYAQVMTRLVVPKLRYLDVGGTSLNTSLQSVDRSPAKFTLEIDYSVHQDDILALLMLFPGTSHLRVLLAPYDYGAYVDAYPNDEFLALLGPTSTGALCPALTELKLGRCSFGDVALLNFIRARMTAGHPLSQIEATFPRGMDVDVVKGAQQWIAEGLQVNLRYEQPSPRTWEFDGRAGLFEVASFL
ncbi:hypothetical protein B0H11DRAFT_77386 [Mycena galericulata]|nr:hypothetical protein B0H11DRAFT_77386 [Mycena galericulata]